MCLSNRRMGLFVKKKTKRLIIFKWVYPNHISVASPLEVQSPELSVRVWGFVTITPSPHRGAGVVYQRGLRSGVLSLIGQPDI